MTGSRGLSTAGRVVLVAGLGVLLGALWFWLSPAALGQVVQGSVRYGGLDDPRAAIQAWYVVITGVGGLLGGVLVLGPGEQGLARRAVTVVGGGLVVAGLVYLTGFLLGPPTEAAQIRAGAQRIQVPMVLSSPLLVLVWPMVTSLVVTVGMLMSLMVRPPARR